MCSLKRKIEGCIVVFSLLGCVSFVCVLEFVPDVYQISGGSCTLISGPNMTDPYNIRCQKFCWAKGKCKDVCSVAVTITNEINMTINEGPLDNIVLEMNHVCHGSSDKAIDYVDCIKNFMKEWKDCVDGVWCECYRRNTVHTRNEDEIFRLKYSLKVTKNIWIASGVCTLLGLGCVCCAGCFEIGFYVKRKYFTYKPVSLNF